jgi:hypothetical protein
MKTQTYHFHADQKVTTWFRTNFQIEANSIEEANKKAVEAFAKIKDGDFGDFGYPNWEEVQDVVTPLDPEDNNWNSTEEIYTEDGVMIWENK